MRPIATALALSVVALAELPASADELRSVHGPVVEQAHEVRLTMHRGHAELVVRRTLRNDGQLEGQAALKIDLPTGAVATGLRTLVSSGASPRWVSAELLDSTQAERRYGHATGGRATADGPALLGWRTQFELVLRAAHLPAGASRTLEYTLLVPTSYQAGRHVLSLSRLGTKDAAPDVELRVARAGDRLLVDGKPVGDATKRSFGDAEALRIELAPAHAPTLSGSLATVPMGDRSLLHFRLDAAPRLSDFPRGAWIVVVLDASRSMSDADTQVQAAAARSFLSHLPDARVDLVVFDRHVRSLTGTFVSVPVAQQLLELFAKARRGNGSHLDAALAEADARLSSAPPGAPRRVLALTDMRVRPSLEPGHVSALPRSGALLHLAAIRQGRPGLVRQDEHSWARVPRATGGLMWFANATAEPADANEMTRVFEDWARPTRLERVSITAAGSPLADLAQPDTLEEGEAIEELRIDGGDVGGLAVRAELWATPVRIDTRPDPQHAQRWAAMVFGSHLFGDLRQPEMKLLAARGHVVSPVSSLLIDAAGSALPEDFEWAPATLFGHGFGRIGSRSGGRGLFAGRVDAVRFLREAIAPGWARCGGAIGGARLRVLTTSAEIVDVVDVQLADATPRRPGLAECLKQVAWEVDLAEDFRASAGDYQVQL